MYFFYRPYEGGSSVASRLCLCDGGFICGVCFVITCSSSNLFWMPEKTMLPDCGIFWVFYCENTPIQIYIEKFTTKNWKFSDKKSDCLNISAQKIDCGYSLEPPRRGGSNEYPQSMFLSRNKKDNAYPCKPQFCYIKVGFKGVKIIWVCFL